MVFPATAAPLKNIATRFSCQQNSIRATIRGDRRGGLPRHEDPKRSLLQAKFHRAITDQFTVQFDRDRLVALHTQSSGLEIFDLGNANIGTKHDVLQVFDDFEITQTFEDDYIQKAVIERGVFEKGKGAAIQTSIAHQDKRTFIDRRVLALNE